MARRPPVPIPWPLSTSPGSNPQESAGRLINCRAEPLGDTGSSKVLWRRVPGLTRFSNTSYITPRGSLLVVNLVYQALKDKLITIDSAGVETLVGTLSGSGRVTFARNNAGTPQVACVTENGAFQLTPVSVVAWADADLPQPNSVCFQDGYFFFTIGDRRCFATGLNAITVDSSCFITVQSRSSDTLLRGIAYKGLLFLFCSSSCEIWNDTANAAPAFPYSRMAVIDRGLIGASAIAGWEDGFGKLCWVADDNGVYRFDGSLQPEKVSPPDLDALIAAVTDKTTLVAGCYVHSGKSIWHLSSPDWTWEFNINTEKWNERESFMAGNNTTGAYSRGRLDGGINAFGKWLVGDYQTGDMLYVDDTNYTEVDQPLRMRMESGPVQDFPNRLRVARADFDWATGVGIASGSAPMQTAPQVGISWSNDDGQTWGNPLLRPLGEMGNSKRRVTVLNTGQTTHQGRRWRMDVSDAVYGSFMSATQSADPRAW